MMNEIEIVYWHLTITYAEIYKESSELFISILLMSALYSKQLIASSDMGKVF